MIRAAVDRRVAHMETLHPSMRPVAEPLVVAAPLRIRGLGPGSGARIRGTVRAMAPSMRTLLTALCLFLFGLSTAFADKATTLTKTYGAHVETTKTWTLKNGVKVTHTSYDMPEGKSWSRLIEGKNGYSSFRGSVAGSKVAWRQGQLGNVTIRQVITGNREGQGRMVEVMNSGTRPNYRLLETRAGREVKVIQK